MELNLTDFEHDSSLLEALIQLYCEDAEGLIKGKHQDGEDAPDSELAARLFASELQSLKEFHADHSMARSIARAVVADESAILQHTQEEARARRDRAIATRGSAAAVRAQEQAVSEEKIDDETMERLAALYIGDDETAYNGESSSSSRAPALAKEGARQCVACMNATPLSATVECPCSHAYCENCVIDLFRASMDDESLFPPRCCGKGISLDIAKSFLSTELIGTYHAKELEYSTQDRTYCHVPTCSTFVPTAFIHGEVATCVKCGNKTCILCKGPEHDSYCPEDTATMQVLRIAKANGWQRCDGCGRLVELDHGCNHMTCLCGAQFCYECGKKWKTCRCEQWRDDRLLQRANVIVDRDGVNATDERRLGLVTQVVENLRENHGCLYHSWKSRGGSHRCEECHHVLDKYIYECTTCRILSCRRCRYNRVR